MTNYIPNLQQGCRINGKLILIQYIYIYITEATCKYETLNIL